MTFCTTENAKIVLKQQISVCISQNYIFSVATVQKVIQPDTKSFPNHSATPLSRPVRISSFRSKLSILGTELRPLPDADLLYAISQCSAFISCHHIILCIIDMRAQLYQNILMVRSLSLNFFPLVFSHFSAHTRERNISKHTFRVRIPLTLFIRVKRRSALLVRYER